VLLIEDDKAKAAMPFGCGRWGPVIAEQLQPCLFDLADFAEHVEQSVLINALGDSTYKHLPCLQP